MSSIHSNPYRKPSEIRHTVNRLHKGVSPLVHPQQVLEDLRRERAVVGRFNGWLADHIVGLAGTMGFFYFLCLVMGVWAYWQTSVLGNKGFDPFPYAFLFFALGGIMQSLFVPTMLTASNRATLRDRIKDEADHRAWGHLYDVNDEQLKILRQLAARLQEEEMERPIVGETTS
ncbi:MAG: DUF1003 domain-containing protein [Chloroflexi bacterium]|nr:DUF1003 domain-containing protein [Chloroflexota bacterium]MCL5959524.1 DUF1003 domain-containing protein [Chloroflexota bacterium]